MAWSLFGRNIDDAYGASNDDDKIAELEREIAYLGHDLREAKEDLLKVSDAFDNIGWSPLDQKSSVEIPLETVKRMAQVSRGLYTLNPFVNRGVNARIGYIWGRGVQFDGVDDIADTIELNRRKLFNNDAYTEFERALATDGNVFIALPTGENPDENTAIRVPLDQIFSAVCNPDDAEDIWYYKREWNVKKVNATTGEVVDEKKIKYYPTIQYVKKLEKTGKNLPRRWNRYGVEQNYAIQHVAVNRQIGWRWGVPDVAPVVYWAKAYKEYLEDNAMLVKAYSRIAWTIQAGSAMGGQAAAAQVMRPPSRDPFTGEVRDVGGTAVMGPGTVANPTSAPGSQVDFDKGSALASAIASGLQVSKVVITSDPGSGNRATAETLDLPTLKAMEARQQLHTDRFTELFDFWGAKITPVVNKKNGERETKEDDQERTEQATATSEYAVVSWPQIISDSTKDRIAALGTATELGVLYKQEARKDALDVLGISPYKPWDVLPTLEDDPAAKQKMEQEQANAELAFEREQQAASVIAKQGVSGGISAKGGAQSTNNQARDNRKADSRNK